VKVEPGVAVQVVGLSVGWSQEPLLVDLSFEVRRGSIFAILGGSGSGKSTLFRHLIGLEAPLTGRVEIAGVGDPLQARGRPRFGVLFQSSGLLGSWTLGANLELPLRRWTALEPEEREAVVCARLGQVGLCGYQNHLPAELSGGMRKRGGIARALVLDPELVFLDEPGAGLDPVTAAQLDDLILTLNRNLGLTVVLVTHELASIERLVEDCILLDREEKGILARGDPRQLRVESPDPRVRAFFQPETLSTPAVP